MWQTIKNWIKNKLTPSKPLKPVDAKPVLEVVKPTEPIPEIPTKEETESFPNINSGLKIALVRGHGGSDSGAVGNGTSEVEYNSWVMDYVLKNSKRNVKLFLGSSSMNAVLKSVAWFPDITIQLHLNDADTLTANGCEVLVISGDTKSYPLAERFAKEYGQEFSRTIRRDKGKKVLSSSDRGAASVRASVGIKMLVEPFFIRNKNDFVPKEQYAKFLTKFVDSI